MIDTSDESRPEAGEPYRHSSEPESEPSGIKEESSSADEAAQDAASIAARVQEQVMQGALFFPDLPSEPVVEEEGPPGPAEGTPEPTEGAPDGEASSTPDELDAIRAELGGTAVEVPEGQGTLAVETGAAAALAAAPAVEAEAVAEEEAVEALVEAGEPAGADNEPEAVEALLDAEADSGLTLPAVIEGPDKVMSLPFLAYDAVWLVFSAAMVLVLRPAALAGALDLAPAYPMFVFGGLLLTILGPLMTVFLWVVKRYGASEEERTGILPSALLRGALATFAGVAMWWVAILALNFMKTGRLL